MDSLRAAYQDLRFWPVPVAAALLSMPAFIVLAGPLTWRAARGLARAPADWTPRASSTPPA